MYILPLHQRKHPPSLELKGVKLVILCVANVAKQFDTEACMPICWLLTALLYCNCIQWSCNLADMSPLQNIVHPLVVLSITDLNPLLLLPTVWWFLYKNHCNAIMEEAWWRVFPWSCSIKANTLQSGRFQHIVYICHNKSSEHKALYSSMIYDDTYMHTYVYMISDMRTRTNTYTHTKYYCKTTIYNWQ